MKTGLQSLKRDWVATDLDGTLFSRHWASECAVPGTWRETLGHDGCVQHEPSSWVRPETHRLFLALASAATIVPVTARDESSFARVVVPGLRLCGPAILANGAIVLDADGEPDEPWVNEMSRLLAPWQARLERLCEVFIQRSGHIARPRLVAGPAGLPAYLVAKAPEGWWGGMEGMTILAEMAVQDTSGCCVAVLGNELQILPPGLGKAAAVQFVQQQYFGGQSPLLCLGDQLPDLPFMNLGGMLAAPAGSLLGKLVQS